MEKKPTNESIWKKILDLVLLINEIEEDLD